MSIKIPVYGIPVDSVNAGCQFAPAVLREEGLFKNQLLQDQGDLSLPVVDPVRDVKTGIRGFHDFINVSKQIQKEVTGILSKQKKVILLGGCCSILIGIMAAFRQLDKKVGLAFLDGHWDYYDGKSSANGELADMELGILLGQGPKELTMLNTSAPIISEERIVVLGPRDLEESLQNGARNPRRLHPKLQSYTASQTQQQGSIETANRSLTVLESLQDGFWIHLDLDILSSEAFSAVDYHQPCLLYTSRCV